MNLLSRLKQKSPKLAALFQRKIRKEPITSFGAPFHVGIHKSVVYWGSAGLLIILTLLAGSWLRAAEPSKPSPKAAAEKLSENDRMISANAQKLIEEGRQIFRFDTFGSEAFWGDMLQLHKAIAGEKNGGVGPGVSPKTALSVGLKVDADALPKELVAQIKAGKIDLNDPATTVALLKLDASSG